MAMIDPSAPAQPADDAAGDTEICLKVAADGSMSVYTEKAGDESAADSAQPADSIGTALKMILQAYKGLSTDEGDQFQAGFGANGPTPGAAAPVAMRGE